MKNNIRELLAEDKNLFGLPNILTMSRLFFLPFILFFLAKGTRTGDGIALLFMLLASASDFLDGFFARKLNMKSQFGRMIDPLIDKLSVSSVMLLLAIKKGLPVWFVLVVIGRDLFILVGSLLVIKRMKTVAESNIWGKVTATSFAVVIILYTLQIPVLKNIAMWVSLILVPMSLVVYVSTHWSTVIKNSTIVKDKVTDMMQN